MACVQVVDGGNGLQIWRVAAINSLGQTNRVFLTAWAFGAGRTTSHRKNTVTKYYTGSWAGSCENDMKLGFHKRQEISLVAK
jgi:hypothetical protein